MREYRIAFFTADWNYELVESTLHGLKRFVDEHENVHLCIFDCFGKDVDNARNRSEYAVFDLADLNRFDGLLIQGNQLVLRQVRESIVRRVAESGIPAVTIDCALEGCVLVGIDNERAQREMTEHVIRRHGARRLVYLTGILDNGCPEGLQRRDGFMQACRENGIAPEDIEIIRCTWRTSDGAKVARRWLSEGRALPDAFICANDEMALGMIGAFEETGCHIPDSVIVTGFDNLTSAELSSPRLSTVHRDYGGLNYAAMEVLLGLIDGTERRREISYDHALICSESCGCGENARPGYIRDKYFRQTQFLKNFYIQQDEMAGRLFEASDLLELMDIVENNHSIFGCDNVYLCVNDYYFDNYDKRQWSHGSEFFGKNMILAPCGRAGIGEDEARVVRFPTSSLLPGDMLRKNRFLMFYPLHYNTYSIGYLVMDGISEAAKLNLHESIFNFLDIAIENVRKKGLLRQLNSVLDDLYVHDALTGLYNRFGYERFGQETFNRFMRQDGEARILFIDMDDMKSINDRFGHELGDAAIRAAAECLRGAGGAEDFVMRYGGDEFLAIQPGSSGDAEGAIQSAVARRNAQGDLPFEIALSVGVIHARDGETRTLDELVQAADTRMYERKKRRKAARG
ncbi:MAG: GGDEF domain-containing protein [Clostridia bacterium]|nr:GGDEF domain-containing protein [Clostridia bacterium]